LKEAIAGKVHRHFGRPLDGATREQIWKACALVLRDEISSRFLDRHDGKRGKREVHYMSLEFLMGRSMIKNAYNLDMLDNLISTLEDMGINAADLFETEPDAGLGNGGLGRLAACYIESMTTLGIPATGYSLCYEYGIFAQKILDGKQVEVPDNWLTQGETWLIPATDEAQEVHFGGRVEVTEKNGRLIHKQVDTTAVLAVPKDMLIAGYQTRHVNKLRLWESCVPVSIDMDEFLRGGHVKAQERAAVAGAITKLLYPEDNHYEGKTLRLRQQYFFVSATVQSICSKHKAQYKTLRNFHEKHVIQINDTHPALVIPELMRILLDEEGMGWLEAWAITCRSVAYTNHTVMAEALECWSQTMVEQLVPRIWQILCEINDRYLNELRQLFGNDYDKLRTMAIIWDGGVRMANLCICACYAVNGVSELHSTILRNKIFNDEAAIMPRKFTNVTNGVDHRRWLAQINPALHGFIVELLGDDRYLLHPDELLRLNAFRGDAGAGEMLAKIKYDNKLKLIDLVRKQQGLLLRPDAIFDVQVKRLHEYKRQLLNVLHILTLYRELLDNPAPNTVPRVFFFGAKAASGYYPAKRIIQLINSMARHINNDPLIKDRLKVVFLENYRVSLAETVMPATELSEQISMAGKEASGTGNMKFMFNGALTVGTLDGANVEMFDAVGADNIFIFGLKADEVETLIQNGTYSPGLIYKQNEKLRRVLDMIGDGFSDGESYADITQSLLIGAGREPDPYLVLADYQSYVDIQAKVSEVYRNPGQWNDMALANIAGAGRFASDRSIEDYARTIWQVPVRADL
jgi:starch phosphorylase